MKPITLLLLCCCLQTQAQTLQPASRVFDAIHTPCNSFIETLVKKGFKKVYGGPRKEGGYLYLYGKKTTSEWLFIYGDGKQIITQLDYYLPTKKQYLNLYTEKKLLTLGEELLDEGRTEYEGKKYYHLVFRKEK